MDRKLYKKIIRTIDRRNRRPIPIFSKNEYDKYDWMILNIFFLEDKSNLSKVHLSSNRIKQLNDGKFPNVLKYLCNRFTDSSSSINEILFRIKDKINHRPVCHECGQPTKYYGYGKYSLFCCPKCANSNKDKIDKSKSTNFKNYGVEFPTQVKSVKEKIRQTCLKKYGVPTFLNSNECKQIKKKKYGVEYPFQSKEILEKCKKTIISKYGVDNYAKTKECHDKMKETCFKKYGVNSWSKTSEFKNFMHDHKDEINNKRIKTKIKNGTLNTSYEEQQLFKILKEKYPDAIAQYKSKEYPFYCDFYIPSEKIYIEYQGYPTHGGKPFENTNEDRIKLNEWKSKEYDGWIYDWTKRDVNKRKCAKSNNLRWIEFFNYDENVFLNEIKNYIENNKNGIVSII